MTTRVTGPRWLWTFVGIAAVSAVLACGNDDGSGDGNDAGSARDADPVLDAAADAGPADQGGGDAAPADGGLFTPGEPPTGDPELEIFAAKTEDNLDAQSPVLQGDLLYWECGIQAEGIGHVWASFELATAQLEGLTTEQRGEVEDGTRLQLVDRSGFVIAQNEGLAFALDFETPGVLSVAQNGAIRMVLNRDVVGETTRPSNVDGEIVRYRVTVPIPGGTTFVREAWVDTLVPPAQSGC